MCGTFGTSHKSIADFMELCEKFMRGFAARVHGKNEWIPSVEVRSAFTFVRSAIGWSGKVGSSWRFSIGTRVLGRMWLPK